ncbi:MAG: putative Signal transduction histidine kinase [Cyanobacteria bacterium RYN_339]|nr:putative Signal transduction histidine kinase [Cyanobacteria bacterium RYN_339]
MTYPEDLERRLAERTRDLEEKTRLLEEVPCGIKVIALDPIRITYWNRGSMDMYGFEADEALGRHPGDLLKTRFDLPMDQILALLLREGTWRGLAVETRKDGVEIVSDLRLLLHRDDQRQPVYVISTSTDISKERLYLTDLARSRDLAEAASQAKSEFLATMSHELRTPLNAIIGYSEMLSEEAEDEGQDAMVCDLQKINGAGQQLLQLINDILDLAKIEAGRMELYLEEVDLASLVAEVMAISEPLALKSGNVLQGQAAPGLGTCLTDALRLKQVLLNLTSNACKFTSNGTVSLHAAREDDGTVAFVVRDTGIGISPEQLSRLFQQFQQADASISRRYGGTGLGLAIAKQLCEILGAEIMVESSPGEGSTFTVRLHN